VTTALAPRALSVPESTAPLAPLLLPPDTSRQALALLDRDRDRGTRFGAGSGSGKSVMMGQVLAFFDFLRGVPQVLFDPHGPLIDNVLYRIALLPPAARQQLWRRVLYVDMSGRTAGRIVSFPLHFELGGESRRDVADRFLMTLRKLDPHLQSASVQGWNALYRVGAPTGIVLAALGLQINAAEDLLRRPENWWRRLHEAEARYPEVAPAVAFFRDEYIPLLPTDRIRLANSYLGKLAHFTLDPGMMAMFALSPAGIDFAEVVDRRQTVLLDFRYETNLDRRRFKTRWVFDYLMAYVKHRGAGRHTPLGVMIDELTELTNQTSLEYDLFSADLDELINVYGRNYSLWLTLAHQELFQVSVKTKKTLLTMGTQIIGVTADMEAARDLAYQYAPLDPYRVKRWENVWGAGVYGGSTVLEKRPVDMPLEEQTLLAAQRLAGLQPFHFLVKSRSSRTVRRVDARPLIARSWANEHPLALAYIRHQLALRSGRRWGRLPAPKTVPERPKVSEARPPNAWGIDDDQDIFCDPAAA
jgi:hypothetical protein